MKELNEAEISQLEAYWNDQLEAADRAVIEKRLAEDPDYAGAAAEWELLITEGFQPPADEKEELQDIRKRLLEYTASAEVPEEAEATTNSRSRFIVRRWYIGLAAAAAVLLFFWLGPLSGLFVSPSSPYDDYFAHLPRDNANLSTNVETGREAYDRQDYRKAYPALLAEVEAGGDSLDLIYAGVAAIGSGRPEAAIPILEPLLAARKWRLYDSEIRWYLALAYLNSGQETDGVTLLQALAQSDSEFAEQAEALLNAVE